MEDQRLRVRGWLVAECGLVSAALGYASERLSHNNQSGGTLGVAAAN